MAAAADWITLDEAKAALNITGTTFDVELARYVTAASQRLDKEAGAAVIRTVTGETHDGGRHLVELDWRPVATVTTVTEYTGVADQALAAETNTAKTAYDYVVDTRRGWLRRRSAGGDATFPAGRGNVVVTYTAGRVADTASVSPTFKLAASIFLSHLWRPEQGSGSTTFGAVELAGIPTFGVPHVVRDLLYDEIVTAMVA